MTFAFFAFTILKAGVTPYVLYRRKTAVVCYKPEDFFLPNHKVTSKGRVEKEYKYLKKGLMQSFAQII
ncbi:hypothetical protein BN938_1526 [Mucinivorans hirudinis]|uniref:Uncharacterized protein n=1 Tax=Mucinivorans hirudinis TaxID=1433126 RepID=A0A060RCQ7_9BACT|nr:hypothetical protein BN938_1526 [Mucinivorans hirudinis]